METMIKNIRIWRFLAFLYDIPFILLATFTVYMLCGMVFKMDSDGFQSIMIYLAIVIIILYLFFGELFFKNTFGKYLFGLEVLDSSRFERLSVGSFLKRGLLKILWPIEGLVLLFSRSKKRVGDIWAGSIVVNKENNTVRPVVRLILGTVTMIGLYLAFSVSLGLAAKKADFYKAGTEYLTASGQVRITGLTSEISQSRDSVTFCLPVSIENNKRYARIHLGKNEDQWVVSKIEFLSGQIGTAFSYSFTSGKK